MVLVGMSNRVAALFNLEQSRDPETIERGIREVVKLVPRGHQLRRVFVAWLRNVLLPSRVKGLDIPGVEDLEEFEAMLAERVVQWQEQWKMEGLEQGRQERRQEGEAELLLRLLARKFGPLPKAMVKRVRGASAERLLEWGERLLSTDGLADIFGD